MAAFIVESYKNLTPDSGDITINLLTQISLQLAAISNDTHVNINPTPNPGKFSPPSSALRVNAFWFVSLVFGLVCALSATLVQQWARNYLQAIERRPAPHKKG